MRSFNTVYAAVLESLARWARVLAVKGSAVPLNPLIALISLGVALLTGLISRRIVFRALGDYYGVAD